MENLEYIRNFSLNTEYLGLDSKMILIMTHISGHLRLCHLLHAAPLFWAHACYCRSVYREKMWWSCWFEIIQPCTCYFLLLMGNCGILSFYKCFYCDTYRVLTLVLYKSVFCHQTICSFKAGRQSDSALNLWYLIQVWYIPILNKASWILMHSL